MKEKTNGLIERIRQTLAEWIGDKKADEFSGLSFVESYSTASYAIENIETYYKLISKITAIPKAIQEISLAIVSRDWKIYDTNNDKEVDNPPEELINLIRKPWAFYDFSEFVGLSLLDLLIAGNIFVYRVRDKTRPETSGVSLRRLDPQYVQWHEGQGWVENGPNGGSIVLDEKYLIHVKYTVDPYNPRWGKGVIANNATLFENMIGMLQFRKNFIAKGCFPGGVFSVENQGAINETQTKKMIEDKHEGSANAGKPLVLSGKVTYHQIQLDPTTMKISQELILLVKEAMDAFGLPRYMHPSILEGGQKYNNHSLQQEHFIKSTVIPNAKKIETIFNNVVKAINSAWEFRFDIHAEVYDDATLQSMEDSGAITPNEHRELVNIPPSDDDGMDTHWIPSGKQPMDIALEGPSESPQPILPASVQSTAPEPQPAAQPLKPAKDEIANGRPREKSWRDSDYVSQPDGLIWSKNELAKAVNKNRIRRDFVTLNNKTRTKKSRESLKPLKQYLTFDYSEILISVARHAQTIDRISQTKGESESVKLQVKSAADRIIKEIYDETESLAKLEKITLSLHKAVGEATFSNTANILTVSVPFVTSDPGVAAKLDVLRKNGPLVTQVTKGKISETIISGIQDGKTHNEIAKDIWIRFVDDNDESVDAFSKIYRPGVKPQDFDAIMSKGEKLVNRAVLIARTEVAYANKIFSTESMEKSGVVKSVTIIDCTPCPICAPHQNVPVDFDKADTIQNIHPNCEGTIVPSEIGVD